MDGRGQTTFEYLLLVGGAVIIAITTIYFMTTGLQESAKDVTNTFENAVQKMSKTAEKYVEKIRIL